MEILRDPRFSGPKSISRAISILNIFSRIHVIVGQVYIFFHVSNGLRLVRIPHI